MAIETDENVAYCLTAVKTSKLGSSNGKLDQMMVECIVALLTIASRLASRVSSRLTSFHPNESRDTPL